MKKRKLKRWFKITLTIIILAVSLLIYLNTIKLGSLAQTSTKHEILTIISWAWLLLGQTGVILTIWGGKYVYY